MGAAAALTIGVALAIIFALGIAGIIPRINAKYPILALVLGTAGFLGGGIALAGVKPRKHPFIEVLEGMSQAVEAMAVVGKDLGAQMTLEKDAANSTSTNENAQAVEERERSVQAN